MPYLLDRVSDIEWSREQMHAIHPRAAALARALRGQAQEANAAQVRFSQIRQLRPDFGIFLSYLSDESLATLSSC
jgi:hypothetical protein